MKLFSRKETKNIRKKIDFDAMNKTKKIVGYLNVEIKKMNKLNSEKEEKKREIEQEFLNFSEEVKRKRTKLEREVSSLESRRKDALKPIKALKLEAENRLKGIERQEETLEEERTELDNTRKQLVDKKEDLLDRKQLLDEREKAIVPKEQSNSLRAEFLKKSEDKLAEKWNDFNKKSTNKNSGFILRENRVSAREKALVIKKESLDNQEKELRKERLHIHSQQQTLKLAFDEARRKRLSLKTRK